MTEETTIRVGLDDRAYDIAIGSGLLGQAAHRLQPFLKRGFAAIVTDRNVAASHLATLQQTLEAGGIRHSTIILEPGEAIKSYAGLQTACDGLLAAGVERDDLVIALGGGVIGDLAGFAAAVVRRGVRFVQIPTSLLAQVDSSVGGKTGINSSFGKNLIGAFHQPVHVLIDLALLKTLPMRERRAGYAEIVKYGLLGDAALYEWLEQHGSAVLDVTPGIVDRAVAASCALKARVVTEDETETGIRALLNLGHTFGHALEGATGYSGTLLHGEAVAVGMIQAFRFSAKLGHCDPALAARAARHLKSVGLPSHMRDVAFDFPPPQRLLEFMRQDKKASGGKLTFILARGIGEAFVARGVPDADVLAFLEEDMTRNEW